MILAIDTCHATGSIALVDNGRVLKEAGLDGGEGHGHLLFTALDQLGVPLGSIDAFAAGQGPGTFTGVRVGLTAIKGLAEACGKPAFGISNLAAVATYAKGPRAVPFYDARRGDVYARLPDAGEVVLSFEQFLAAAPPGSELVSFGDWPGLNVTLAPAWLAGAIGLLAEQRFRLGERPDPAYLDANYVRRTDAEKQWQDLHNFTRGGE
jgi:tRNA threonylcarbamoyladenosine biosynthesis protein TsaB